MISKEILIGRNASYYSSYSGVIDALSRTVVHKIGQPLLHFYIDNTRTGSIKTILTIGKKDGVGADCYDIINEPRTDILFGTDSWVDSDINQLLGVGDFIPADTKLSDVLAVIAGIRSATKYIKNLPTYKFGAHTTPVLCELGIKSDVNSGKMGYFVHKVVLQCTLPLDSTFNLEHVFGNKRNKAMDENVSNRPFSTRYVLSDGVTFTLSKKENETVDYIIVTFPPSHPKSTIIEPNSGDSIETVVSQFIYDIVCEDSSASKTISTEIKEILADKDRRNIMTIRLDGVPIIMPSYLSYEGVDYKSSILAHQQDANTFLSNSLVNSNTFEFDLPLSDKIEVENMILIPYPRILSKSVVDSCADVRYFIGGQEFFPAAIKNVEFSKNHKSGLYTRNSSTTDIHCIVLSNPYKRFPAIPLHASQRITIRVELKVDAQRNSQTSELKNPLKFRSEITR